MRFIAGLDLGQAQDYTALSIIQVIDSEEEAKKHQLRYLERFPLGTHYTTISDKVAELMLNKLKVKDCELVVDATGVGKPVIEMLKGNGLKPISITITGGHEVNGGKYEGFNVPKRDLVSTLQILFQCQRLKIAQGLSHSNILVEELLNFKAKITAKGNDTYEAWREGLHDDLVLSVALACWYGENTSPFKMPRIRWI